MGQIIRVQCTKCDFQKDIYVGGGLLDCELRTIHAALPKEGQRMLAAAAGYGARQFSITRKFCVCDSCGAMYALPVVSYDLKGLRQELYGACPQCGAAGNSKWKEDTVPPCPDCGSEMAQQPAGHWD